MELLDSLEPFVGGNLELLSPVDKAWQPTDFLPDLSREDWAAQIQALRGPASGLTDEMLVVLVGDMVTEEALPSYAVALNLLARDYGGDSDRPWAKWLRGWTAEENRHGDLLNAYLRLTGRVDMRSVELTIHYLIKEGFNPNAHPDLYGGLVYTSFQERATRISHNNAARLAAGQGDESLAKMCRRIAGDESRHERFYTLVMGEVFALDPEGAMLTFQRMMRTLIAMPGRLMFDGKDPDLFDHFAVVAQRSGIYTAADYAGIIRHLVAEWGVATRSVSGKAAKAQEYLCRQGERYDRLAEVVGERIAAQPLHQFSWIHNRKC